ncbi:transcriptional regulator, LysR-family domain protein [Bordetella holmesii 70147]|nr:transcriptional regulator, LysR-family domain protein [Bordetella holmesii 70147]EWM50181.1 transcriptional regulator, LysR-family domain protein [Bordetella holmesii 70147]
MLTSSSSCRIILLTVDCVTNNFLAACVKLAQPTVSTK